MTKPNINLNNCFSNKMSITDNDLLAFKAISEYIHDLAEIFSATQHSLELYSHLINKTTLTHSTAIHKNISAFKVFCVDNRDFIESKNIKDLKNSIIKYSDKAFIDMTQIFKVADTDTKNVIMKHLLVISALVDPTGKAREILKKNSKGKEGDFLSNIISKVEQNVDPNANPMEAVSSILQSGVFTELITGMNDGLKDGSLDLGSLMSSVQNMVAGISNKSDVPDENKQMMNNMMATMMSSMSAETGSGSSPGMPDMMAMLSGLTSSSGKSIEEKIDEEARAMMKKNKVSEITNEGDNNLD